MPQKPLAVEDLGPLQVEDLGAIGSDKLGDYGPPDPNPKVRALKQRAAERAQALKGHEPVAEAAAGAVHGAVSTIQGLSSPIRKAFGMAPATPPPAETTTAGKVGRSAEQIGEFFIPSLIGRKMSTVAKIAKDVAGTYAIARAQGDPHPLWAAAMSAVTAPLDALLPKAAPSVRASAEKSMTKALGRDVAPTEKAVQKAITQSVPRALDLGLHPTWQKILTQAGAVKEEAGQAVQSTLASAEGAKAVSTQPILDALDTLLQKAQNVVPLGKHGQPIGAGPGAQSFQTVTFNRRLVQKVADLRKVIEDHGPTMEARQLHNIKEDWNTYVYQAKQYPNMSRVRTQIEARAKKAAIDAIRGVFVKDAPAIADVDREYHLARQTYDVIADAAGVGKLTKSEQAVKTGLARTAKAATVGSAVGAAGGFAAGHSPATSMVGGLIGAATATVLERAMQSPGWRLLPAATKNRLATALVNGQAQTVKTILAPLLVKSAAGSAQ